MRSERGITLVEMLIAMTVFLVVLGGALSMLQSQLRSSRRGIDESGVLQNMRFGADLVSHEARLAGSNTPDDQPPVIYASATSFAFNADYVSNLVGDIAAVYIDPDAPSGHVNALASAITIPGSLPAFSYPSKSYGTSAAETITFFFQADLETSRTDDFVLLRQVNSRTPEPIVRNVLAHPSRPFFQYYYYNFSVAGVQTNQLVPTAWLPLRHTVADHGGAADTAVASRVDSLRTMELSYSVTNGRSGIEERIRRISTIVPLPNLTAKKLRTCGRSPLFSQALTATPGATAGAGVDLAWTAAIDETTGERDVLRYIVWRRNAGTTDWGDPLFAVPAGKATYTRTDANVTSATAYDYAVAALDCTPSLSTQSLRLGVIAP